jgi:hypothetical protein
MTRHHSSTKRSASPAEVPDRLIRERDPLPQSDGCLSSKPSSAEMGDDGVAGPARVLGMSALKDAVMEDEPQRPPMPAFLKLTPEGELQPNKSRECILILTFSIRNPS